MQTNFIHINIEKSIKFKEQRKSMANIWPTNSVTPCQVLRPSKLGMNSLDNLKT